MYLSVCPVFGLRIYAYALNKHSGSCVICTLVHWSIHIHSNADYENNKTINIHQLFTGLLFFY